MASDDKTVSNVSIKGLDTLTIIRQLGLFVGLAASIAIGVWVVLWSQTPNYGVLFGTVDEQEASLILDALQKLNIAYKMDDSTGAILVPTKNVHDARIKLAAQGLPKASSNNFVNSDNKGFGFGVSQAKESVLFQKALEMELARTIISLSNVKTARIHLAIPKQSAFIRNKQQPSASVTLGLYAGRTLNDGQVAAITHLVSSSVPNLSIDNITVVDQMGNLLSVGENSRDMALTSTQFDYTRKVEKNYINRIESILGPILGANSVRAQVTAEIDFTSNEQTQQSYNPDVQVPVSVQLSEENSSGGADGGIPGALSNQAPGSNEGQDVNKTESANNSAVPKRSSRKEIRNYELDKTISHTKFSSGQLRRLSAAIVIDDLLTTDKTGQVLRTQRSPEEIERITDLIKKAIGFNIQRGDSVNVINAPFTVPAEPAELPEIAVWEKPWVWDVAKQVLGGVLVLFILFGVLKPIIKSLSRAIEPVINMKALANSTDRADVEDDQVRLSGGATQKQLAAPPTPFENNMQKVQQTVSEDPKLVAQVVKNWVAENE